MTENDMRFCCKCEQRFQMEQTVTNWLDCYTPAPEWVSIKDKLPPEKTFSSIFIVTIFSACKERKFVEPLHYIAGEWYTMIDEEPLDMEYEVTHWMPLPEPPCD